MLLLFFNPVCDIAAFAFAPQSVVSGTAGSATIWSLVFAPWLLGERRTWIDIIGGVIVCVGCIGVGVFGPKDTPDYTYDQIIGYFERTGFLVFAAGVAVLYAVMAMCCRLDEDTRFQFARKLSFGCIGGSVGGFYVFLKVSLALVTLGPEGQWDQWQVALPGRALRCVAARVRGVFVLLWCPLSLCWILCLSNQGALGLPTMRACVLRVQATLGLSGPCRGFCGRRHRPAK